MSAILIIDSPRQSGTYATTWVLSYMDNFGNTVKIGEPITVAFDIVETQPKSDETPKPVEDKPVEQPKKEEPKKERSQQVQAKAGQMFELFPGANKEVIYDFIEAAPNATIEELIDSFLSS